MDQNPQNNTNNNQDLDSLLKEFQSLSATTPEKPVEITPNVQATPVAQPVQQSTNMVESQANATVNPVNNAQPVNQSNIVMDNKNQVDASTLNMNSVNPQQSSQPMTSGAVQQPQQATVIGAKPTPNPEVDMSVLNEKVDVYPGMNVTLNSNGDGTDISNINVPDNNGTDNNDGQNNNLSTQNDSGNNKSNLMFLIVIFLIIGAFILFIPKIDSFLKKKPGMEAKPTPTATAKPTNKPVADKDKEKTLVCTFPITVTNDTSTEVTYKYYYKDEKITKLETTTNKKYLIVDDTTRSAYTVDQVNCGTLATDYANILGFAASCEEKDNTFIIKNSYDLANFVNPTTITINGQQKTLKSDVNYGDDINEAKELAEMLGASCK